MAINVREEIAAIIRMVSPRRRAPGSLVQLLALDLGEPGVQFIVGVSRMSAG